MCKKMCFDVLNLDIFLYLCTMRLDKSRFYC